MEYTFECAFYYYNSKPDVFKKMLKYAEDVCEDMFGLSFKHEESSLQRSIIFYGLYREDVRRLLCGPLNDAAYEVMVSVIADGRTIGKRYTKYTIGQNVIDIDNREKVIDRIIEEHESNLKSGCCDCKGLDKQESDIIDRTLSDEPVSIHFVFKEKKRFKANQMLADARIDLHLRDVMDSCGVEFNSNSDSLAFFIKTKRKHVDDIWRIVHWSYSNMLEDVEYEYYTSLGEHSLSYLGLPYWHIQYK